RRHDLDELGIDRGDRPEVRAGLAAERREGGALVAVEGDVVLDEPQLNLAVAEQLDIGDRGAGGFDGQGKIQTGRLTRDLRDGLGDRLIDAADGARRDRRGLDRGPRGAAGGGQSQKRSDECEGPARYPTAHQWTSFGG